jgi:hypothetical protein
MVRGEESDETGMWTDALCIEPSTETDTQTRIYVIPLTPASRLPSRPEMKKR